MDESPRPKQPIRRFDVFAEYQKLQALREGRSLAEAKGYGLWLAKVVAGRRYGATAERKPAPEETNPPEAERVEEAPFRSASGILQTDELFDREIVDRMGRGFYQRVFAPTIARHVERGDAYEAIRDVVRRDWKP